MDKQQVEQEQKRVSDEFDTLTNEKTVITSRLGEVETELVRLQGEYRAYAKILGTDKPEEDKMLGEVNTVDKETKEPGNTK